MTCTITKIDRDFYSLQPDGNDPEFTLDMQVANQSHRLFPAKHKPFSTRDDIDPSNSKRIPACWNPPDVCVAAVERKLCEHLSNNGMGTPYSPNKTVQSVLLDISNTQGMFLNGNSVDQLFACADRICKLARSECSSPLSIPATPTYGRNRLSTVTRCFCFYFNMLRESKKIACLRCALNSEPCSVSQLEVSKFHSDHCCRMMVLPYCLHLPLRRLPTYPCRHPPCWKILSFQARYRPK